MRIPVVGGVYDGLDARAGDAFVWIGTRVYAGSEQGIVYRQPAPTRVLYRRVFLDRPSPGNPTAQVEVYLYAGDTHWCCGGCGAYVRKAEGGAESLNCGLCGGAPVTTL